MNITRYAGAPFHESPMHDLMQTKRLQGLDVSPTNNVWVGLSTYQPGGGSSQSSSDFERVYVVVEGELCVIGREGEFNLGRYDSCLIPSNEPREIFNKSTQPATVLVIVSVI